VNRALQRLATLAVEKVSSDNVKAERNFSIPHSELMPSLRVILPEFQDEPYLVEN